MLAMADWAQQGLFDSSWCGNVVPRDSFYGLLAEQGERAPLPAPVLTGSWVGAPGSPGGA